MEALHPVSHPSPLVPNILVVCPEQMAAHYKAPLAGEYRVAVTSSPEVAIQFLARTTHLPVLVVDGDGHDGGAGVCETARSVPAPPLVLLTLSKPDAAGRVIDKCDSILLKPFARCFASSGCRRSGLRCASWNASSYCLKLSHAITPGGERMPKPRFATLTRRSNGLA